MLATAFTGPTRPPTPLHPFGKAWILHPGQRREAHFGKAAAFKFIQLGFPLRRHLKGRHLGIDRSDMEANASLSGLLRRNTAESYRDYARQLARAAGVDPVARPAMVQAARAVASRTGKALLKKRGEKIERSFSHVLDSGGPRRPTLRDWPTSTNVVYVSSSGWILGSSCGN